MSERCTSRVRHGPCPTGPRMTAARMTVLLVALVTFSGCATSRAPAALAGEWHVVGHAAPGISAMSSEEADGWLGTVARFSGDAVRFGRWSCEAPEYAEISFTESDFREGFRISGVALGITEDRVGYDISCSGADWVAPGSWIIVDGERLLTTWDGVFFEMEKAGGSTR